MPDTPWTSDACSLVDAFRRKERSPAEELEATLVAIENSDLNCFSFLDPDRARRLCAHADVSLPFDGVPTGIRELFPYEGWPNTEASLVFMDRIADHTSRRLERLITPAASSLSVSPPPVSSAASTCLSRGSTE